MFILVVSHAIPVSPLLFLNCNYFWHLFWHTFSSLQVFQDVNNFTWNDTSIELGVCD